jgi:hypothetical protein
LYQSAISNKNLEQPTLLFGVIFSLEREKWWGFFMGWVLKGSRQKLVVCRYEEEPARGVSLVVK